MIELYWKAKKYFWSTANASCMAEVTCKKTLFPNFNQLLQWHNNPMLKRQGRFHSQKMVTWHGIWGMYNSIKLLCCGTESCGCNAYFTNTGFNSASQAFGCRKALLTSILKDQLFTISYHWIIIKISSYKTTVPEIRWHVSHVICCL